MTGQKTFTIARALVRTVFYLTIAISVIVFGITTYHLFQSKPDVANLPHQSSMSFKILDFGIRKPPATFRFADEKLAAIQPSDMDVLHVPYRSPLGYFQYFITLVFLAAAVYGIWLLRGVFDSISVEQPFAADNARRIRNIGLLLIGVDVVRLLNYIVFGRLANHYFNGENIQLVTELGSGFWLGLLVLALAIVYRRGVDIYSDTQLTI